MNFDDTARFFGPSDRLWPNLFKPPVKQVIKLCLDCRKREVKLRQKYCPICSKTHIRESKRKYMRRKRGLDVEKLTNSPIRAEALTRPEKQVGYPHSKTSIFGSSFSTRPEMAQGASEAHKSIEIAGDAK